MASVLPRSLEQPDCAEDEEQQDRNNGDGLERLFGGIGQHLLELRRARLERGKCCFAACCRQLGLVIHLTQFGQDEIDRQRACKADQSIPHGPLRGKRREPAASIVGHMKHTPKAHNVAANSAVTAELAVLSM